MADAIAAKLAAAPDAPPPPPPHSGPPAEAAQDDPDPPPPPPPPRVPRVHSAKYFNSHLDRLFPSAKRIKFWKRREDGKLSAIPQTYSPQDLLRSTDIEEFIATYLVPRYRAGDYEVATIDGGGKMSESASVSVMPEADEGSSDSAVAGVLDRMMDRMERLEERIAQPPPVKRGLLDELDEIEKVSARLRGTGKDGGTDPMALLLLMNQRREPQHDAEVAELRREIRALARSVAESRDVGPTFDPGPSAGSGANEIVDAAERIARLAKSDAPAAAATQPKPITEQASDVLDLIDKGKKALGLDAEPRWVGALMQRLDGLAPTKPADGERKPGLRGVIEEAKELRAVAGELFGVGEGGDFGDKVLQGLDLLTTPERIEAIGKLVDRLRGTTSSSEMPRNQNKRPALPSGFDQKLLAIKTATDERGMVEATMRSLEFLGKHTVWQPYVRKLLETCTTTDREGLMKYIKSYFDGLRGAGKLDADTATKALAAFNTHIDGVIATVQAAAAAQPKEES